MRYSVKPRHKIFVKSYGFLFFSENIDQNISKIINSKYSEKCLDSAKTSVADIIKTASKGIIEKAAETAGNVIGNKVVV